MFALNRQAWMDRALRAEVDPDLFFPGKGDWAQAFRAKVVCRSCDVKELCLAYAVQNQEMHGIWGGTTAEQRKRLRGRNGLAS